MWVSEALCDCNCYTGPCPLELDFIQYSSYSNMPLSMGITACRDVGYGYISLIGRALQLGLRKMIYVSFLFFSFMQDQGKYYIFSAAIMHMHIYLLSLHHWLILTTFEGGL